MDVRLIAGLKGYFERQEAVDAATIFGAFALGEEPPSQCPYQQTDERLAGYSSLFPVNMDATRFSRCCQLVKRVPATCKAIRHSNSQAKQVCTSTGHA